MRRTTWLAVAVTALILIVPGLLRMGASLIADGRSGGLLPGIMAGWEGLGEALLTRIRNLPAEPGLLARWGLTGALVAGGLLLIGMGLRGRGDRLPARIRPGVSIPALARRTGLPQDVLRAQAESEGSAYPRRGRRGSFFRPAVFAALPPFSRLSR